MAGRKPLGFQSLASDIPVSPKQEDANEPPILDSGRKRIQVEDGPQWPSREPKPAPQLATAQLSMRLPPTEKQLFDELARRSRLSKPELLRRMMRAYQQHPNPDELDHE